MEKDRKETGRRQGKFLTCRSGKIPFGRWAAVLILLFWDGLLFYMIVEYLIEPVYGAVFVTAVSVYLGYKI